MLPELPQIAWSNRGFHQRAAKWLAEPTGGGIGQFIDLGSGLPTQQNTHEVVHQANPDAHVVYVDIDPTVEAHAQHMLAGNPHVGFIRADLCDSDRLLSHPDLRSLIDPRAGRSGS